MPFSSKSGAHPRRTRNTRGSSWEAPGRWGSTNAQHSQGDSNLQGRQEEPPPFFYPPGLFMSPHCRAVTRMVQDIPCTEMQKKVIAALDMKSAAYLQAIGKLISLRVPIDGDILKAVCEYQDIDALNEILGYLNEPLLRQRGSALILELCAHKDMGALRAIFGAVSKTTSVVLLEILSLGTEALNEAVDRCNERLDGNSVIRLSSVAEDLVGSAEPSASSSGDPRSHDVGFFNINCLSRGRECKGVFDSISLPHCVMQ